jgi:ABC-2 type transport system permease protein
MLSLFKKEITQFFGSIIGVLVSSVFLILTGLFLWVFPGNFNLINGGYASLSGFFDIAPWIYLFLIPAVTMRLFAEEKRSGTMELLLSRPLSELKLVLAKFLAAFCVVLITLIPTLIYFFSIYKLGNPVGCIDTGATWGSYLGLLWLAIIYLSIGVFTSALTDNQIVAFLSAVFLCFVWYAGFGFLSQLPLPSFVTTNLSLLGIDVHYESISRGVVDSRDLIYFIFMAGLFVLLARIGLEWGRVSQNRTSIHLASYVLFFTLSMWFAQTNFFRIDLTAEKRYTLSDQTNKLVNTIDSPVNAEILLAGDLPAGFLKLQTAIVEKLRDFKTASNQPFVIHTTDPYEVDEKAKFQESLLKIGIAPINLRINTDRGISNKTVFPSLILRANGRVLALNLLKNDPYLRDEENLIRSVELLEYEIARGLKVIFQTKKDNLAFLTGQDELEEVQVQDITTTLSDRFDVERITSEELLSNLDSFKCLVVANPIKPFTERDKFAVDQFLMRGGRILWLVDPVSVSLDSLSNGMSTLAFPRDLNLKDQFFHYGVRYNSDLIQDVECQKIKVNTAAVGQPAKYSMAPWYFSPLLFPSQQHPIGRNVNRVLSEFVSSIDFVGESSSVKKTVLLTSSSYARSNQSPMLVNLGMIDAPPARNLFTKQWIPTGVLVEGSFSSVFKNRMNTNLGIPLDYKFITESKPSKMIFVSDGALIANKVTFNAGQYLPLPLGYDKVSNITFGNKDFLVNSIYYLCDDSGLMELRSRAMQMRLLDKVRLRENKLTWQLVNVLSPVLLILCGGVLFLLLRRRRYSAHHLQD